MKILFFILSVVLYYFFSFKAPLIYPKRKLCIFLGGSLVLSPIIYVILNIFNALLIGILIKYFNLTVLKEFLHIKFFPKLFMSFLTVFFINLCIILVADNISDYLIKFHQKYNIENLNKNPVKFVLSNKEKIKLYYRIFFMLGSCLMLYRVWFKME